MPGNSGFDLHLRDAAGLRMPYDKGYLIQHAGPFDHGQDVMVNASTDTDREDNGPSWLPLKFGYEPEFCLSCKPQASVPESDRGR